MDEFDYKSEAIAWQVRAENAEARLRTFLHALNGQDPSAFMDNLARAEARGFMHGSGAQVTDVVEVAGKRWLVTEAGPEEVAE